MPAAGPCWRAHARLLGAAGQPTAAPASRHVLAPARTQRRPSPPSRSTQRRPARQASGQQGARCGRRRGGDPPRRLRRPTVNHGPRNSCCACAILTTTVPAQLCTPQCAVWDGCCCAMGAPRQCVRRAAATPTNRASVPPNLSCEQGAGTRLACRCSHRSNNNQLGRRQRGQRRQPWPRRWCCCRRPRRMRARRRRPTACWSL